MNGVSTALETLSTIIAKIRGNLTVHYSINHIHDAVAILASFYPPLPRTMLVLTLGYHKTLVISLYHTFIRHYH